MKKYLDNPLVNFDGVAIPVEDVSMDEPDWDELVIGPCVNVPGWSDGDDGYEE